MASSLQEIKNSLGNLNKQVKAAERLLRMMPGIEQEAIIVDESEMPICLSLGLAEDPRGLMRLARIATWESEERMPPFISLPKTQFLYNMRVSDRNDFARHIPELIELCVKRQSELPPYIDGIASRIAQAIAKTQALPGTRANARASQNHQKAVRRVFTRIGPSTAPDASGVPF